MAKFPKFPKKFFFSPEMYDQSRNKVTEGERTLRVWTRLKRKLKLLNEKDFFRSKQQCIKCK